MSFDNEVLSGSVFFTHRPPAGSDAQFKYGDFLESRAANPKEPIPLWEFQFQLRFKVPPAGTVFFGVQLWDAPMKLNLITRSLCKVILKLGSSLAQSRGIELLHSFGNNSGDRAMIALPMLGSDRIFVSNEPVALPITFGGSDKGAWRVQDGKYVSIDKKSLALDTNNYFTVTFATGRLDWAQWSAQGIPGLGTLDLARFWGTQAAHVVLFDVPPKRDRRYFMNFELASVYSDGSEEEFRPEEVQPTRQITPLVIREEPVVVASLESVGVKEDDGDEVEEEDTEARESVVEVTEERLQDYRRPGVGDHVRIIQTGRCGDIVIDDGSELTYKIEFNDGAVPFADWFAETSVAPEERAASVAQIPAQIDHEIVPEREVADNLGSLIFELDAASSAETIQFTSDPKVPWYFKNDAGALWWCIQTGENFCWRPHDHLQELYRDVMEGDGSLLFVTSDTPDSLEYVRRLAENALAKARQLPGLLEEFLSRQVDLTALLSVVGTPNPWEPVGMVDAEGCVCERPMLLDKQLLWYHRKRGTIVPIDVCGGIVDTLKVAGTLCVSLQTPKRQFLFVCRTESMTEAWASRMKDLAKRSQVGAGAASREEVPVRWATKERTVLNNVCLCLESADDDAVSLSARLLRQALDTQGVKIVGHDAVMRLARAASKLKCIDLRGLSDQDVWCFWLNIYHALLVHARIACGLPRRLPKIISFFNENSYIVAGHVFSLAEIEHCILRSRMSPPYIGFGLRRFLIQVWQRSDNYLQERPCIIAPPCLANAFRCRRDWRLNFVINAGNMSSCDVVPIFERCPQTEFDAMVERATTYFVSTIGRLTNSAVELPYAIYRYRDDAPECPTTNKSEGRWAHALFPGRRMNASYSKKYDWTMRPTLGRL